MAKSIVVHVNGFNNTFEYEGKDIDCGVAPHGLVIAEQVPDVTGQSETGTTNKVLAQFNTWDAVEVK